MISCKRASIFKKNNCKSIFFLILLLLSTNCTFVSASVSSVSHSELWSLLLSDEKLLLIDIRTKVEYRKDHIPMAVNIHYTGDLFSQATIDEINSYSFNRLITYCSCTEGYTGKLFVEQLVANGEFSEDKLLFLSESYHDWPFQKVKGSEPGELDILYKRTLFPLDVLITQFGMIFLIDFVFLISLFKLLKRQFQKQLLNQNFS